MSTEYAVLYLVVFSTVDSKGGEGKSLHGKTSEGACPLPRGGCAAL